MDGDILELSVGLIHLLVDTLTKRKMLRKDAVERKNRHHKSRMKVGKQTSRTPN